MKNGKVCVIVGNNPFVKGLNEKLNDAIYFMLDQGFTGFYVPFNDELFGEMAVKILNEAKRLYPDTKIYTNISSRTQISFYENKIEYFLPILNMGSFVKVFDEFNSFMVSHCDGAICHVNDKRISRVRNVYRDLKKLCNNIIEM